MANSHNDADDVNTLDPVHDNKPSDNAEELEKTTAPYPHKKSANKAANIKKAVFALVLLIVLAVIAYGLYLSLIHI